MTPERASEDQLYTLSEVVEALCRSVYTETTAAWDEGQEIEFPSWNSKIPSLALFPIVAAETGLGSKVRCEVVGDAETGVALVMRSRNIFDRTRYGYFIQRERENGLSVWHGPAIKPERDSWIGAALLVRDKAEEASLLLTNSLLGSLISHAKDAKR